MRKKSLAARLSVVFMLITLICTGCASAEDQSGLHLYLGIPVKGTTPEIVTQIMREKSGAPFYVKGWTGRSGGIADFGYEWNLQLDFNENCIGLNRILLSSAQPARVLQESCHERFQSDLVQFVDVETQLTALYGEPDCRFFLTDDGGYGPRVRYMFSSGLWNADEMMSLCEKGLSFHAVSVWGNVVLHSWIDWKKPNVAGNYLSRVMLYYYPSTEATALTIAAPITLFPPPDGN